MKVWFHREDVEAFVKPPRRVKSQASDIRMEEKYTNWVCLKTTLQTISTYSDIHNIEIYARKNGMIIEKSHCHKVVMRLLSGLLFGILLVVIIEVSLWVKNFENKQTIHFCGNVKINKKCLSSWTKKQKRGKIMRRIRR